MNIKGNDFHLIVNCYAFMFLNIVVFEMKTSIYLHVEMAWVAKKKNNFTMLRTKLQRMAFYIIF